MADLHCSLMGRCSHLGNTLSQRNDVRLGIAPSRRCCKSLLAMGLELALALGSATAREEEAVQRCNLMPCQNGNWANSHCPPKDTWSRLGSTDHPCSAFHPGTSQCLPRCKNPRVMVLVLAVAEAWAQESVSGWEMALGYQIAVVSLDQCGGPAHRRPNA